MRLSIQNQQREKQKAENEYKKQCNKYGIKPLPKEESEDSDLLKESSRTRGLRNPARSEDDETLFGLRKEIDARRSHVAMLKSSIQEARQE